jgi:predicted RNA-binding Zn ribbon-like protein
MTGESPSTAFAGLDEQALELGRRLPQPGGRDPAPGELGLLQSFLNTHFDLVDEWGADLLGTPAELTEWFSARGLLPVEGPCVSSAQRRRVLALREGMRELARANRDPGRPPDPDAVARMNHALRRTRLGLLLVPDQVTLSPRGGDRVDRALAVLSAIALAAMIDGRWRRLKACPGEHCGWVFYDQSRNNSSRWCSMAVCGGRTKARRHYRRHRIRPR